MRHLLALLYVYTAPGETSIPLECHETQQKCQPGISAFDAQAYEREIGLHREQLKRLPHCIIDVVVLAICPDQANDAIGRIQRREGNAG